MNWLDAVLLIILAVSILTSYRKGFSREIIGLVTVVIALLFGLWFYGLAGTLVAPYVNAPTTANFVGFVLVFVGVLVLGGVVSYVVGRFLRVTGLSFFDHVLGAAFGLVRGTLIAVALIMGIVAFSPAGRAPESVVNSHIAPYVADGARVFVAMAPHDLKEGFRSTYAQVKAAWKSAVDKELHGEPEGRKGEHERKI